MRLTPILLAFCVTSVAVTAPPPIYRSPGAVAVVRVVAPRHPNMSKLMAEKLRSTNWLAKALESPTCKDLPCLKNAEDPVQWFQTHLRIEEERNGTALRLQLTGRAAGDLSPLLQALVNLYMEEVIALQPLRRAREAMAEDRIRFLARAKQDPSRALQAASLELQIRSIDKETVGDPTWLATIRSTYVLQEARKGAGR